jgi:hypothetical protein
MLDGYPVGSNAIIAVRMLDASGNPVAGVASGTLTATLITPDGTGAAVTLAAWVEHNTGAFAAGAGKSVYMATVPAANIAAAGNYVLGISSATGPSSCVAAFSAWADGYTSAVGSNVTTILSRVDVATSSRMASFTYTAPDNTTIANIYSRLGAPTAASISADIANIYSRLGVPAGGVSIANDVSLVRADTNATYTTVGYIYSRLGNSSTSLATEFSRLDATVSSRMATFAYTAPDNTGITNIYNRIGAPVGASISVDIASAKTAIDEALGIAYKNSVLDNQVYTNGKMTSARLRVYNNKTNADAATAGGAQATGLLYTFTISATYDGSGNLTFYKMTR